jgi:DNA recombination protein RmuC
MSIFVVILLVALGILIGAAFAAMSAKSKTAAADERRRALDQDLTAARGALERQTAEIRSLTEARASLNATLASERQAAEEKLQLLADTSEQLKSQFKAMAAAALENNNANFLQLANSTLQKFQTQASGELAQKEQAVKNLVEPIAQSLTGINKQIQALEQARSQAYGTLTNQVGSLLETQKALQTETGNLVKALREPQARGRWGELQLHRVIEMAGMLDFCDFEEQQTATNDERRYRPDVVVKLPGGKNVVIDSKVPLTAYLAALDAVDDATRNARLADHARQVRQHIDNLSAKAYWAQFQPTPEFVVLFLPGEVFFRAALDGDIELIEYGVSRRVIVASPTTLIALLKAVAYGWNEKNLAESARRISEAGKELYKRLCTMTRYMEDVGKKLSGAVKSYDEMVRSMERRVFPEARKFPELDRSLPAQALPEIEQLDKAAFELQAPDWDDEPELLETQELPFEEHRADRAKA